MITGFWISECDGIWWRECQEFWGGSVLAGSTKFWARGTGDGRRKATSGGRQRREKLGQVGEGRASTENLELGGGGGGGLHARKS